jgi:hypothetical protein
MSRAAAKTTVSAPDSVDDVLSLMRRRGGRVTTSRRLLLEALFDASGHHTAEELAEVVQRRAPDVHLSTVYRNLDELERLASSSTPTSGTAQPPITSPPAPMAIWCARSARP